MSNAGGTAGAARGTSRRTVGILCAIGAALAWGFGSTTSDYALSAGVGNDTFLVIELGIGFLTLVLLALVRGELAGFRSPGLLRASRTGLIQPWGAYTLGNIAIIFSSGAFVALVGSMNPVLVALLAAPYLGERVSRPATVLMVISIGGVALVVGGAGFDGTLHPFAILFALSGLVCSATYALLSSKLARTVPIIPLVAMQLLVATAASAVVWVIRVLILQGEPQFPANETEWIVTVATGIFGGAAPFILYLEATRRIPTTTVSQFSTLVPVVALIGGVVFLNDVTTPIQLLGTAIVVVSLSLLARYARAH